VYSDSLYLYTPSTNSWFTIPHALPSARKGASVAISEGIYTGINFGLGIDSTNTRYNDWWFLLYDVTAIEEIYSENILIYPNPASHEIRTNSNGMLSIYDVNGKVILRAIASSEGSVNISSLAKGVYYIKLQTDIGQFSQQLVVQ
jgi:hypothetical protein